ncbi:TRAP transporter permease [Pseudogracilibacillus sp. SO30301A]|uniref:TRAP transporter permease n=1 Tax=Pseudogracilibacillus sp. SO30301A TaxID=3098291 RepID=UPI00300DC075
MSEKITKEENIGADGHIEVLEKYDAEARFRVFTNRNITILISVIAVGFALYQLYTSALGAPTTLKHRAIHVAIVLCLIFLLYPVKRSASRAKLPWYDAALALIALSTAGYIIVDYLNIIHRGGIPNNLDIIFGVILVLLVLEAARRMTGWALPILAVLFFFYALLGRGLSGIFRHRGYEWDMVINQLYVTTEGIYGTAIGVSATYIFLFILFGAVLGRSGMGQFFNDIALAIAGHTKGGPAKVAVLASAFLGSINGSAIANVVTTGTFTIPLMKRVGYKRNFAGAVEATASVGGQILPPVMGAAAFIMAEILGIPYSSVALAAILPAGLYYLGVMMQVHLRASKEGLEGMKRSEIPKVRDVMKERGHLILPLLFLIYMLFFSGKTIIFAAFWTIVATVLVAQFRKTTRMAVKDLFGALEDGTRSALSVAIACAAVGIIVGVATLTGFGLKLANGIILIGGESLFLTLVFTMIACIVLGMGLPSIPTYIITSTMAAPALVQLGIQPFVDHMFVFYFGLFANLTPPVALAAFAAAGISGGDPMRTGFASMKLAIAGFIVPFAFVYNSSLLLIDTSFFEGALVTITAIIGVIMLGAAAEGYLFRTMGWMIRILSFASSIMLITPNRFFDVLGIGIVGIVLIVQWVKGRREGFGVLT